jgi:hypothetical protein
MAAGNKGKIMEDINEDTEIELESVITNLLIRVTCLEKLLIENKSISIDDYNEKVEQMTKDIISIAVKKSGSDDLSNKVNEFMNSFNKEQK